MDQMNQSILVAEDHEGFRTCLSLLLTDEGYNVVQAMDGSEAIDAIGNQRFNLILTNLRMPKADGFAVLRYASEMDLQTPVIVISGYGDQEMRNEAVQRGARDYIFKPVTFDDLLKTVKLSVLTCSVNPAAGGLHGRGRGPAV